MLEGDAAVSLLDNVHQKVALRERLNIARIGRIAEAHLPPGVGGNPILIQFFLVEEIIQRDLAPQLRALDGTGHLV